MIAGLCLALSGCGNGENPAQTVAILLDKTIALGKGMNPHNPVDRSNSSSDNDNRYVVFESAESEVVKGDTNRVTDVFVYDQRTKQTIRVSVGRTGAQANGGSFAPVVSRDGRVVAFESLATNLVSEDTNRQRDIFVHDRETGETTRVSVNSQGVQANSFSQAARLSEDGRYVAFESFASNLVPGDTNGVIDVFVHDRQTKRTTRISVASDGTQANNVSINPILSADGRQVAFESFATNLSNDQVERLKQIFIHNRETGQTLRVIKAVFEQPSEKESVAIR
jgi:Tol biopolymer transport system component